MTNDNHVEVVEMNTRKTTAFNQDSRKTETFTKKVNTGNQQQITAQQTKILLTPTKTETKKE